MAVDFKPMVNSSYDEESGVSIPLPRMLPDSRSDGLRGIEYQYAFRRDGERIGGLGLLGTEVKVEQASKPEWVSTLEIDKDIQLKSFSRLKQDIQNDDDPFEFLQKVAQGLVNVFVGQRSNSDTFRYVVTVHADLLRRNGIDVPPGNVQTAEGWVVLADVLVPPHVA